MPITAFQEFGGRSMAGARKLLAALLARMSTPPKRSFTREIMAFTVSGSRTSVPSTGRTSPPLFLETYSAGFFSLSVLRLVMTTFAPKETRC
jgi:hypothetical protein